MEFSEFGFDERLMDGISAMNYKTATPIQEQVIPIIREGGDLIASAQTGTGLQYMEVVTGLHLPQKKRHWSKG